MERVFKKLTKQEVKDLQNLVTRIMDNSATSSMGGNGFINIAVQEQSARALIGELEQRNTIITELSTITFSILEEISSCIEHSQQITHELAKLKQKSMRQELQICDLRVRLNEVVNENRELKVEVDFVRSERDMAVFRGELAVDTHDKEKQGLIVEILKLKGQLDKFEGKQEKMQQLQQEIQSLHENNDKLQQQLESMRSIIHETNSKITQLQSPNLKNAATLSIVINDVQQAPQKCHSQKQQPQTSVRGDHPQCPRSSLKLQLKQRMQCGIYEWDLSSSRYRQTEKAEEGRCMEVKELDMDSKTDQDARSQYDRYCYIDEESKVEIYDREQEGMEDSVRKSGMIAQVKESVHFFQPNIEKQEDKVVQKKKLMERGMKKQKKQNKLTMTGHKIAKAQGMSRIRFLLNALSGQKNDYGHRKAQKFKAFKKKQPQNQTTKRFTIKRILSSPTAHSLSPVPSLAFLRSSANNM